jgi:hypothetical protein
MNLNRGHPFVLRKLTTKVYWVLRNYFCYTNDICFCIKRYIFLSIIGRHQAKIPVKDIRSLPYPSVISTLLN